MADKDSAADKDQMDNFVKQCRSISDREKLRQLVYDLCARVVNGQSKADPVVIALIEVIALNSDIINILSDVLLLFDVETQTLENKDNTRDHYLQLLSAVNNRVISEWVLKERLDYETTGDARIVSNKKTASTKFIKLKTRLFYKQQKFNLCREESEGYGKLIVELCQGIAFDHKYMLQVVKKLIGCFNLDPNRVLDIILECFEYNIDLHKCYIPLIQEYLPNSTTLTQILAFKLSFYQNENSLQTPDTLYQVIALALHYKLIELNQLYDFLYPNDNKILDDFKNELSEARTFAKKINSILTNPEKQNEDEKNVEEERQKQFLSNQKLGLILALLKVGDWKNAELLIRKLPEYYAVSFETIANQLCDLIHYSIDKIYKQYSGLPTVIASKIKSYKCAKQPLIKQFENVSELKSTGFTMISSIGPFLYKDTLLISKIIRFCRTLLSSSSTANSVKHDIITILDEAILPSMSLVESNCALSEELWLLMKSFPYQQRYKLYTNWKAEPSNTLMIKTRAATLKRIKYIMKRLSKENVKPSGRQIGKLSHSNPSFLFQYILSQIQSYDNLIGPVVDALKYLTTISYDVLAFCMIEALADPAKEQTKHEGATISPWLLSLASFSGSVVKKYPIELPGILQFVANQLKSEKCLDLLVLKEIVQKMAGIEALDDMTNEQLSALSGGELLRAEGGYFNQVRNTKKSTSRLKDALLDNNLAMPLCILIAQQRNCILFHQQSHIKLVGKLYDQCQETLVQYGSFLANTLNIDDYIENLPPLEKLISDYSLSADITFFLVRPMIIHYINSKFDELKKVDKTSSKLTQYYIDASDTVTTPLVKSIVPAYSAKFWDDLSPRFFVTFWTLTMYDLQVPTQSYERELKKFKDQITAADDNKDLAPNKRKKEKEKCLSMMEKLTDEEAKQQDHKSRVLARLQKEKDQWFQSKVAKMEMTTQFLQHCLFPRCKFAASDALFCAKFVHLLHVLQTPNFSTLICYDRIFGDISYTMCSCTENEANHYGRFLCALLETVMNWHKDKDVFNKECAKFPGFVTKFCEKDPVHVDFENYRHVCHKWHYRLTKAFILCLDSGDYIQIRNSLIILTKVLPQFPVMISFAQAIERRVDNIRNEEKEKRPDLYALATGYSGQLKSKKSTFIPESEFHIKETKKVPQNSTQNNVKTEINSNINIKKEPKEVNNIEKETIKSKNSIDSKEVNDKRKESKKEVIKMESKNKKISNEEKNNTEKNHRNDSRSSSVSSLSPRRTEHRIKEESIDDKEREHKKRKVDSNKDENDIKRVKDELNNGVSNAQTVRSHEKKQSSTVRKRQQKESPTSDVTDINQTPKRRKDDDTNKTKREDSRNKSTDKRSTSRRHKQEDDK
ncbi:THO complex subunit 2-like [Oppia nitens]|uniref:THO complex subunit 2-like n=1 Tax=Oppia nitens TaxID=1686743 RepID=UPI0023DCBE36|nr:THO complex subunit 2-like [Oppia nitens]